LNANFHFLFKFAVYNLSSTLESLIKAIVTEPLVYNKRKKNGLIGKKNGVNCLPQEHSVDKDTESPRRILARLKNPKIPVPKRSQVPIV